MAIGFVVIVMHQPTMQNLRPSSFSRKTLKQTRDPTPKDPDLKPKTSSPTRNYNGRFK